MKRLLLLCSIFLTAITLQAQYNWQQLIAAPSNGGKQDDIYFVTPDVGWSINGSGRIYKTTDGGSSWAMQLSQPGTYFRCVGFIDSLTGFAGNIGTAYFPGVIDTIPLYKTTDGGINWSPVTNISGPTVKGLCAIDVVTDNVIYAAGRVGSPVHLIKSTDGGATWISQDMSSYCSMILDLKFFTPDTGFVFAASNASVPISSALVLYTTDGGQSFTPVFTSSRTNELCWKASFPSRMTGYLTILSYDNSNQQRYIAKTTDGGLTWTELPLVNNGCKEFGIGFVSDHVGWVGTDVSGYETLDGGASWQAKNMGLLVNKIRTIDVASNDFVAYAIGRNIFKLSAQKPSLVKGVTMSNNMVQVFPNPVNDELNFSLSYDGTSNRCKVVIHDLLGRVVWRQEQVLLDRYGDMLKGNISTGLLQSGVYILSVEHNDHYYYSRISHK